MTEIIFSYLSNFFAFKIIVMHNYFHHLYYFTIYDADVHDGGAMVSSHVYDVDEWVDSRQQDEE